MEAKRGLIAALDVDDPAAALGLAKDLRDMVDGLKVNYPLVLRSGLGIVGKLAAHAPVLCDFKVADIPDINARIAQEAARAGAQGLICHGIVGADGVRACVDTFPGSVYVVTELSSPGGREFLSPLADRIARMAIAQGAAGIVVPATRPERIEALRPLAGKRLILAPGVGAQGGTAEAAIRHGADAVIVGRSLYQAKKPREVAEDLLGEIARSRAR